MGRIISSYIFPHPPIIIPEVGRGEEKGAQATTEAVKRAAQDIAGEKPTTIIVTTPHGPVFQDYIYLSAEERLSGDFGRFGAGHVRLEFDNNTELVRKIIERAKAKGIFAGGLEDHLARQYRVSKELDHGALVPLYFIRKQYENFKLVHISIAGLPFEELYKFGMGISEAVEDSDENVVFVGSGDLSHRLTKDAPAGFSKKGQVFDDMLVQSVKTTDIEKLLLMDENLCDEAGECGLRSFIMMFGALDGLELNSEVYSYEGPFGVGYSIARIAVGEKQQERKVLQKVEEKMSERMKELREKEDEYVALARKTVEAYVKEGRIPKVPDGLPEEMLKEKAGTFVSIKKQGQLRGCIGTTGPTRKNIAEEIIYNAVSASTRDPRFDPVEPEELDKLVYSVDILKEPEPIQSKDELDVVKYGVIVKSGARSGLLLPNLEGVNTPEEQVAITLQKAGIRRGEEYSMERFEVIRHK
ncbi:MAG: AmmeMemoRadiSam system protein A [Clostridia bacterium]|nr:AmmeMemoRadiSam system protein A [Clostridia bacterium]